MEISIPTHVFVYALGCLAVIIVIGGITWAYMTVERRISRKREQDAISGKR